MPMLHRIMQFFFHHFYHTFAWTYDFVADVVSVGRWNDWIQTVVPYIQGMSILEIGHGPGHLQDLLLAKKQLTFGLDESQQMGRLTKRRLEKTSHSKFNLICALAESLPFAAETFDTVLSTFPTEFLFDSRALSDVYRILHKDGQYVVLPAALIIGQRVFDRSAAWLFKITGQASVVSFSVICERIKQMFEEAGFKPEFQTVDIKSSLILIVIAKKSKEGYNH